MKFRAPFSIPFLLVSLSYAVAQDPVRSEIALILAEGMIGIEEKISAFHGKLLM